MWLAAGFFDESTDQDSGGVCYAIAGFIGAQLVTATLEMRWKDLLKKYHIDYFKASELNAGLGQFQQFRDDPNNRNWRPFSQREKDIFKEIKTAFTDLIVSFNEGLYGIGAVVVLPDIERLRSECEHAKALPLPYFMCANMVLVEAGAEMFQQNVNQPANEQCFLRPIFDQQEEYSGRVKQAWDGFCEKNPVSSKYLLPPHYESEHDYLTLQAADDLAFEARKLVTMRRKKLPPREPIKRLARSGNIIRIYEMDYDALKIIADAQIGLYPEKIRKKIAPVETSLSDLREVLTEPGNGEEEHTIREFRRDDREAFDRAAQRNQGKAGRGKKK